MLGQLLTLPKLMSCNLKRESHFSIQSVEFASPSAEQAILFLDYSTNSM
jgi:hypothetical protein